MNKQLGRGLFAVVAMVMVGCGGDGGGGTSADSGVAGSHVYTGVLTGATETGILSITINDTASTTSPLTSSVSQTAQAVTIQVSGTLKFGAAAAIPITGTYDTVTMAFMVSGGGYTLTGSFGPGGLVSNLTGTYTGPMGNGSFTALPGASTAVKVYCGTYTAGTGMGNWNLVEDATGKLSGSSYPGNAISGMRSGSTITLTYAGGTATGTVSGTSVTGTYNNTNGMTGTWMGSTTGCM